MLAIEGSEIDLARLLRLGEQHCKHYVADVACYNGPHSFVIAGNEISIQGVVEASEDFPDVFRIKRLDNSHAYHSRLLDGITSDLLQIAEELRFETPKISIEACSDDDWSNITAEKIVRHTREPVRFMDAVRRLEQHVNGPIIWLEAGSGSPVVPMIRRAVNSNHEHVYVPTPLRDLHAQQSLSKATCCLWSNGARVQFWLFHASQRSSYNWINLPPYAFAKTSHWLGYEPKIPASETSKVMPENLPSQLLQLLPSQSCQGETLFEINPDHELYQLGTKGHEVVEQTLCPASMYNEFVLTASRLLSDTATPSTPQLSDLTMSSPLVLNPVGAVLLRLIEHKSGKGSRDFTLFTCDKWNEKSDTIIHATGHVTICKSGSVPATINNFQSLNGLILRRCKEIEGSSTSIGFKGPTVYRAMRLVVTYLDYYHGIQSIYSTGNEAVARISLPASRPSNMGTGFCDPVLIDCFTQVSGILANCFARDEDGEMWVCNFIGEITFTPRFVQTARKKQTWIAYSKYERPKPKTLQCDIFVFESNSEQLVLGIMAISFQKLSIKSLTKTLGRLNSLKHPEIQENSTGGDNSRTKIGLSASSTASVAIVQQPVQPKVSSGSTSANTSQLPVLESENLVTHETSVESLQKVKQMLSDVIEIPIEEIMPDSALESLGVDSLLVTEIFAEVNQRFQISLSHSDFARVIDVQGLARLISAPGLPQPPASCPSSIPSPSSAAHVIAPGTQNDMETILYGEVDGIALEADIYYPNELGDTRKPLPVGESIQLSDTKRTLTAFLDQLL